MLNDSKLVTETVWIKHFLAKQFDHHMTRECWKYVAKNVKRINVLKSIENLKIDLIIEFFQGYALSGFCERFWQDLFCRTTLGGSFWVSHNSCRFELGDSYKLWSYKKEYIPSIDKVSVSELLYFSRY